MKKTLKPFAFAFRTLTASFSLLALFLTLGCGPAKPTLYFYTWEDYIDPAVVTEFEQQNNCTVLIETFESNEDMLAKVRTGGVRYDVILPTTYIVDIMQRDGLLMKLDPKKIENAHNFLDPAIAEMNGDVNLEYRVPYYGGITGLGYIASECPQVPDSWGVYNGDIEKYHKRTALLDDMRETIGAALIYLGYDINTTDDAQLAEAKQVVIKWREYIAKFGVDDVKQDLNSGANYIIHGYGGDILQMSAEDNNIQFVVPKEGAIVNYDNFVVPANANNPELAQKFINFMCDPKNAGRNMEFTKYMVNIAGAIDAVSEETKKMPGFDLSADTISKLHVIKNLDEEGTKKYTKIWDEIKSAD